MLDRTTVLTLAFMVPSFVVVGWVAARAFALMAGVY